MAPLIVTAAVIIKDKKILLAQRLEKSKYSLKWEFPGGKLEEGESPEFCIKREIMEELNLGIEIQDIFKVVYHRDSDGDILLLCYLCKALEGDILPLECNDYKWINIKEIPKFSIVKADNPIVEKINVLGEDIFKI